MVARVPFHRAHIEKEGHAPLPAGDHQGPPHSTSSALAPTDGGGLFLRVMPVGRPRGIAPTMDVGEGGQEDRDPREGDHKGSPLPWTWRDSTDPAGRPRGIAPTMDEGAWQGPCLVVAFWA